MNRIYILVGLAIGIVIGSALFYAQKDEIQPEPPLYETEKTIDLDQKESDTTSEERSKHRAKFRAPSFDVVMIEPDGSAVLAGRATPPERVPVPQAGLPVSRILVSVVHARRFS